VELPQPMVSDMKPLAARMTKDQMANSVLDVLGVVLDPAVLDSIPSDEVTESGFITAAEGQALAPAHIRGYSQMSRSIAAGIDPVALSQTLAGCADVTPACAAALSEALGYRLYRRPLLEEERTRLSTLFTTVAAFDGAGFEHAARAVLRSLLQSPQFLYKTELETLGQAGMERLTTGHELASRLSFYLWQSSPDEELLKFAASADAAGGMIDPAQLEQQVTRMMGDGAKLSRTRTRFWADYTHASTASFSDATPELAAELRSSVIAAYSQAAGEGGAELPLQNLFTTKKMLMSPAVAQLVGVAAPGASMQEYDTSGLPERVGLLTHPGFLASIGYTSFVARGVFITKRVLCRDLPPLPVGLEGEIKDAATSTKDLTPKGASEYRLGAGPSCAVCHKMFEPLAYAFERFDVLGDYRETDEKARPLFTAGYLQDAYGQSLGEYQGVAELMALLETSKETSRCFVNNMLEFASGHKPRGADQALDQAHTTYVAGGGTFSQLVRAIALNPTLRTIQVLPGQ
jgi:hypothetical protein